jgi:tRNA threonylcarbamoyladenosine biosynthesis protein TsaB
VGPDVIVLAIDTCDALGSVAVLRDAAVSKFVVHESQEDYSSWLLPAVRECLAGAGLRMEDVDAYAAAAGPGSFTGVRVGLTTVKAWGEVYRKPIVPVSRLRAIAVEAWGDPRFVAAWVDAHRGQVFGAIYKSEGSDLLRASDEMVIAPENFLEAVAQATGGDAVTWASMDPESFFDEAEVEKRRKIGEEFKFVSPLMLAGPIGAIALRELEAGRFTDPLRLDANYVRRSDAEVFWKGNAAHGR